MIPAKGGYVRPPLVAREPTPRWVSVWAFRLVTLLLLALLALVVGTVVKNLVNTEQNPTFGATAPAVVHLLRD